MSVSGWCSGPEGRCTSPKAHKVCAQRIRLGLLPPCDCPDHESPSGPGKESSSTAADWENCGTTNSQTEAH